MLAVIALGGKQYNVSVGTKFQTEKIDLAEGKVFDVEEVLLVSDDEGNDCKIGMPFLKDQKVQAKVLSQGKDDKIRVFKMKAKKRYSKVQGHRQMFTELEIVSIAGETVKTVVQKPAPKKSVTNAKKTDTISDVKIEEAKVEKKETVKKAVKKPVVKKTEKKETTKK